MTLGGFFDEPTHSLRVDGFDASEDGTGRGTPLVPIAFHGRQDPDISGEVTHPVDTDGHTQAMLYQIQSVNMVRERKQNGIGISESDAMYTVTGRDQHAVAFEPRYYADGRLRPGGAPSETVATLKHSPKAGDTAPHVATNMAVRRLTPRECERLQGFEDDYTLVPVRRHTAKCATIISDDYLMPCDCGAPAKLAADGPRYKAIGNSWAVPVMAWIGKRIKEVDAQVSE